MADGMAPLSPSAAKAMESGLAQPEQHKRCPTRLALPIRWEDGQVFLDRIATDMALGWGVEGSLLTSAGSGLRLRLRLRLRVGTGALIHAVGGLGLTRKPSFSGAEAKERIPFSAVTPR